MGNLLAVTVHPANLHDTVSGIHPAAQAVWVYPSIERFCGDAGYRSTFVNDADDFLGLGVDIIERSSTIFQILPRRWVVERTFAWAGHSRRLSKDYEIRTDSAEMMFIISHTRTLLRGTKS